MVTLHKEDIMDSRSQQKERIDNDCKTLRADQVATILGIGRSSAYALVKSASASPDGIPFRVLRLGNSLLISKKSFFDYLDANGL